MTVTPFTSVTLRLDISQCDDWRFREPACGYLSSNMPAVVPVFMADPEIYTAAAK